MGARESIYQKPGIGNYYRMTPHRHESVEKIWESIEKNPTIYGNGFFVSLCDRHPRFLKYFSKQSKLPLHIDAHMAAKFTMILETIGYVILDCYDNPKQLDKITGYIAMVHKDMRISLQDFLDFTSHLVDYLTTMFPVEMTPECQEELQNYLSSISHETASKIEDFLRYELMDLDEPSGFLSCSPCSPFTNTLIFGQTLLYWKDRKRIWNIKISEWENEQNVEPTVVTSTEDEESTAYKSKTEDELSEWVVEPIPSFDRQGLHRRTQMLTTDMDSTTYTDERRTDGTSDFSDLHILSSIQEVPRQAGNLKKPRSQSEKLNAPKHVTVKTSGKNDVVVRNVNDPNIEEIPTSHTPRQRFRSRNSSLRNAETPTIKVLEKQENEEKTAVSAARQRRRMRVNNLNR